MSIRHFGLVRLQDLILIDPSLFLVGETKCIHQDISLMQKFLTKIYVLIGSQKDLRHLPRPFSEGDFHADGKILVTMSSLGSF